MPPRPVRFIHASDFHLDQPLGGVAEVPDHLRDLFLDAPFRAAQRVFDAVLSERAEFLVLSGNVLDVRRAGPRGALFLADHCRRLHEKGVAVYWAGGRTDPADAWPAEIPLPDNVHRFPADRMAEMAHARDGALCAVLVGRSHARRRKIKTADFSTAHDDLPVIAVAHTEGDPGSLEQAGVTYWALGGKSSRKTLFADHRAAHYAGTPQGRNPRQTGAHGCTLVELDGQRVRLTPVTTDVVRWHTERLQATPASGLAALMDEAGARLQSLLSAAAGADLLVTWLVEGEGPLISELRGGRAAELLAQLRGRFGQARPAVWSLSLEVEPPRLAPPDADDPTLLGEFLRVADAWLAGGSQPLPLADCLPPDHRGGDLAELVAIDGPLQRERVLRQAAALGRELLTGESASR